MRQVIRACQARRVYQVCLVYQAYPLVPVDRVDNIRRKRRRRFCPYSVRAYRRSSLAFLSYSKPLRAVLI